MIEYRISVREDIDLDEFTLRILRLSEDKKEFLTDAGWVEHLETESIQPLLKVSAENPAVLQSLANQLAEIGIIPAQLRGSQGQLQAVNNHLQDMRALAFKTKPKDIA